MILIILLFQSLPGKTIDKETVNESEQMRKDASVELIAKIALTTVAQGFNMSVDHFFRNPIDVGCLCDHMSYIS